MTKVHVHNPAARVQTARHQTQYLLLYVCIMVSLQVLDGTDAWASNNIV